MPGTDATLDEFSLIARYFQNLDSGSAVSLGNGDDAAIVSLQAGEKLAVSVDTMVEGVHFPAGSDPQRLSYRAVAAAVSDLAAMGARPLAMTLAITLPDVDESWLQACRRGLGRAVKDFSLPLVGGDVTRGALTLSVQVLGATSMDAALRRDGARVGDRLYVSGCLGDAAAGLAVLRGELDSRSPQAQRLLDRFWEPDPALTLGSQLAGVATAAIDVSDGLLADAGHLAAASKVGLRIDSASIPLSEDLQFCVPRDRALEWALTGGEDYVLCFTLPGALPAPIGATEIGSVVDGAGVECDMLVATSGYRHFS